MRHRHRFEGPDSAVRFARRIHRDRPAPPRFFGFALLAFGFIFLLDSLNLIDGRSILRTYWPALFVAWGTFRLVFGGGCGRFLGGIMAVVGGVFLANQALGWGVQFWRLIWPVLMIAFGAHILLRPRRRFRRWSPPAPPFIDGEAVAEPDAKEEDDGDADSQAEVDTSAMFHAAAFTAAVQRKIVSQALQGGIASAVVGGLELDLRDCRMATTEARIVIRVVMGEVVLRIPRDWIVVNRIAATLANVENHTDAPVDVGSKRLVLEGSAILGNVEVRN